MRFGAAKVNENSIIQSSAVDFASYEDSHSVGFICGQNGVEVHPTRLAGW